MMNAAIGDLVAYEDQANPRTVYRVVRYREVPNHPGFGGEYELRSVETNETIWADLRQFGWTPAQRYVEVPIQYGDSRDEPAGDNPWGTPE